MSVRYGNVYLPKPAAKALRVQVAIHGNSQRLVVDQILNRQLQRAVRYRACKRTPGMIRLDLSVGDALVPKLKARHAQWIKGRDPSQGTKPPGIAVMIAQILTEYLS